MLPMSTFYVLKPCYACKDSDLGGMTSCTNLRSAITEITEMEAGG